MLETFPRMGYSFLLNLLIHRSAISADILSQRMPGGGGGGGGNCLRGGSVKLVGIMNLLWV